MKKDVYFSKLDAKIIKGFAVLLMLMHHLWSFPERIAGGELNYILKINGTSLLVFLGAFGKICVSIFFFVGGYGMYKLSENKNFNIFNSIKNLFIKYWKVFLIFVPIGFLFFRNQFAYCEDATIYSIYSNFNIIDLIKNFFSFSNSLNFEWWFLHDYLIVIILFPFIKRLFNNNSTIFNIFLIIVYTVFSLLFSANNPIKILGTFKNNFLYFLQISQYVSCFWMGMLFSKDNLLLKLKNRINRIIKLNIFTDLIGILIIFYARQFIYGEIFDIVFVPFLIVFFLDFAKKIKLLSKLFELLGNHSTNIWLIHSFLCYYFYFFVKIVVYLRWGVPCLFVLIILSLLFSYGVNYFWIFMNNGIFKKLKPHN